MDEATAAHYFTQLLEAVLFLHAHDLCHRDLKPENCMVVDGSNQLKVIDFGLSKRSTSAVTLGGEFWPTTHVFEADGREAGVCLT